MGQSYWYAVERNALDVSWERGSYDYEEAVKMAQACDRGNLFPPAWRPRIAVIAEREVESFCIDVISADEMQDYL